MNLTQTELWEGLGEDLKSVFEVFQIALLTLLNQGEDDIHLSSLAYLLTDTVVDGGHITVEQVTGGYGFPAWWQFVDDAHVEVAIEGHGEGTWNRCGRHHQHMRGIGVLAP